MVRFSLPRLPALLPPHPTSPHPSLARPQVRDLLSKDPSARLELRESPERGVHVRGLKEFVVKSSVEMAAVLEVRGVQGCFMLDNRLLCCRRCMTSMGGGVAC